MPANQSSNRTAAVLSCGFHVYNKSSISSSAVASPSLTHVLLSGTLEILSDFAPQRVGPSQRIPWESFDHFCSQYITIIVIQYKVVPCCSDIPWVSLKVTSEDEAQSRNCLSSSSAEAKTQLMCLPLPPLLSSHILPIQSLHERRVPKSPNKQEQHRPAILDNFKYSIFKKILEFPRLDILSSFRDASKPS